MTNEPIMTTAESAALRHQIEGLLREAERHQAAHPRVVDHRVHDVIEGLRLALKGTDAITRGHQYPSPATWPLPADQQERRAS